MKTYQKTLFILLAVVLFTAAGSAFALEPSALLGEGRYFVESESSIVRALFGSRHEFDDGFTSDLTRGELWALDKLFGVRVQQVPLYQISVSGEEIDTEELSTIERENAPDNQVSWGVELVRGLQTSAGPFVQTGDEEQVAVALLDTGVEQAHPDLAGRVQQCVDFTRSSVVTNVCEDRNGHGTHLAGTLAGTGGADGKGIVGVAPHTNVLAYKVCRADGSCWADDVAAGIRYGVDNDADIVALGLSGADASFLVENVLSAAEEAGVLVVAPVGNRGPDESIGYPAAYNTVLGVSALDEELAVPEWVSRAQQADEPGATFAAPAVNVESLWKEGEYRYLSGTSVAVPFVAGLASLVWDGAADTTYQTLIDLSVDVWEPGIDAATGFGLPRLR